MKKLERKVQFAPQDFTFDRFTSLLHKEEKRAFCSKENPKWRACRACRKRLFLFKKFAHLWPWRWYRNEGARKSYWRAQVTSTSTATRMSQICIFNNKTQQFRTLYTWCFYFCTLRRKQSWCTCCTHCSTLACHTSQNNSVKFPDLKLWR